MKNNVLLFILSVVAFSCFAQPNERVTTNSKTGDTPSIPNNDGQTVVAYHVVETVNSTIGSNITIYTVSHFSLVSTNDLGPNNTRVVTPKYAKVKKIVNTEKANPLFDIKINTDKLVNFDVVVPEKKEKFIIIDVLGTYERLLEEGHQSVDMLKKVANNRYFKGELIMAARWYSQLFALTTDLEAVYYFRYSQSLTAVGQTNKADEMMTIYDSKKYSK